MRWIHRENGGGTAIWIEWTLAFLLIAIHMILSGCASSRGNGTADTEELLGQEVKEGRVVEGTLNSSGEDDSRRGEANKGYRIQLVASKIREEADGVADLVKDHFSVPVYIEYAEPFFRVRVGDFQTADEAEEVRKKLADYGFDSAWIVETKISTK